MNTGQPSSWVRKVFGAVCAVLLVALGTRLAASLVAPLIPVLVALVVLIGVYVIVFGRRS